MYDEENPFHQNEVVPETIPVMIYNEDWFHAQSPLWPDIVGSGDTAGEAVDHLYRLVEGQRALSPEVVLYLRSQGGEVLLAEWDRLLRGLNFVSLRSSRQVAAAALREFLREGFGPLEACYWISVRADAVDARLARDQGMTCREFDTYCKTYWNWNTDLSWREQLCVEGPQFWIRQGIPVERALAYETYCQHSAEQIAWWEQVATEFGMTHEVLEARLRSVGKSAPDQSDQSVGSPREA